jgi:hypothetical protein
MKIESMGDIPDRACQYVPMTNAEVAEAGKAIFQHRWLPSWLVKETDLLHAIFRPLMFLSALQRREMVIDGVVDVIGTFRSLTGHTVNGFPIFDEIRMVNAADKQRVTEWMSLHC